MMGNFRGVQIFVVFVVDSAVTKIYAYDDILCKWIDDGRGQKYRGMASSTPIFLYLVLFVQVSLQMCLSNKEYGE